MKTSSWTMAAMLCLAASCAATAADNLLANPGFEDAAGTPLPGGWGKGSHYGRQADDAAFAVDRTVFRSGAASLRLTSETGDLPVIVQSQPHAATAGQRYVLSACVKGSRAGGAISGKLILVSPDYKLLRTRTIFARDRWERVNIGVVVEEKVKDKRLIARIDLLDSGSLWIDDVVLTPVSADGDAADVDSTRIGWRAREGQGGASVDIAVGVPTGAPFANINGVCYAHGFGSKELDPRFAGASLRVVRNHDVLTRMRILSRDAEGRLRYRWDDLDASLDTILRTGAVPQMNLDYVPLDLVADPDPKKVRKDYNPPIYLGPPTDLAGWDAYIAAVVTHCRDTYGAKGWYWIFGNEPEVAQFSMGSEDEYYALYRRTVDAARAVDPGILIGAGSFAHLDWMRRFIARCGRDGTHLGLISWHHYGMVPDEIGLVVSSVRGWASAFPALKDVPLVIDEWNPHLPDDRSPLSGNQYAAAQQAASIACMQDAGVLYETFFIAHHATLRTGVVQPGGALNPTFNVFRLFGMMGGQRLAAAVPDDEPYVGATAARAADGTVSVLAWNTAHEFDMHAGMAKDVRIRLGDGLAGAAITAWLIDEASSNGFNDPKRQELERTTAFTRDGGDILVRLSTDSVILVQAKPGG